LQLFTRTRAGTRPRTTPLHLPRLPVLGWRTFAGRRRADIPIVLGHRPALYTTSGRAAIALALRALGIGPGHRVLVPTYHCPTMVSPVVRERAKPHFYPITAEGLADLDWLGAADLTGVRAMLAAHYFGIPRPMRELRRFCNDRGIALVEDCAHAYFGVVDGLPVGSWGDFAIASLTKFFPVPEGGVLIANRAQLDALTLRPRSWLAEPKALWDAVEMGARYGGFPGVNALLRALFALKTKIRGGRSRPAPEDDPPSQEAIASAAESDDPRTGMRTTRVVRWLARHSARERIASIRRRNYLLLAERLAGLKGAVEINPTLPENAVPYVFPLRVAQAEPVYRALRQSGVPVFRWDVVWPGTPTLPGDVGRRWATEVLQLGCHQDLSEADVVQIAEAVHRAVRVFR
jgi:dTDP-4-amino-4,6-dideoxygalactose transaminase